MLLSILLKDRYFPKTWRRIVHEEEAAVPADEPQAQEAAEQPSQHLD